MDRPTKVRNFQLSTIAKKQILWLDVTVNHFLLMAIQQCIRYLLHVLGTYKEVGIIHNSI